MRTLSSKRVMKWTGLLLIVTIMLVAAGCGSNSGDTADNNEGASGAGESQTLRVASSLPAMVDMMEALKPTLKEEGIELEVVNVSDNIQPNDALKNKEVDANFFQHQVFMQQYNDNADANLTVVTPIYHIIYGGYSKNYDSIDALPDGATIAIPNDPANIGRSLAMFDQNGMIKLKEGVGTDGLQSDIVENPKNYKFQEVDLLMLARAYEDVDLVTMYPAYASPLGLTPKDAIVTEEMDEKYAISLVAREDNKDSEAIQKLAEVLTSDEARKYIEEKHPDTMIPAF
ncbi:MetQ/NlpA family ABC transporter substrate-binding protein [Paenibacillus shunpengii]|uniref:MetQ/NlpA family ABC transporter substrate-binding protein n=1 Tax=Paenibacillus shunpengii TaxID=2054424 RepID=A0ABW5SHK3_9BACL|nr:MULTISPECIES: MetQ/NlpA family ABC transporter substrate-binding protein [unclassified Paenibacillus]SDX35946.1 D-methionine transport system substrate-binding protein [Paenibacillus sp. PDC88]